MDILSSSSINNLINSYKTSEKQKSITPLESRKSRFSQLSTAWGTLGTRLSSLKSLLKDFQDVSTNNKFNTKTTVLSNEDYFTATASSTASNSSYDLKINQLAKNDLVMSDTVASASMAGLSAGTYTFQVASGEFDENIDIELVGTETYNELMEKISKSINEKAEGVVNASVFSPKNGESKLSLVAAESGSANSVTIKDVTGSALNAIGMNFSSRQIFSQNSGGYSYTTDELNSKLTMNGIDITRDSNTISDLVSGVTLQLKQAMEVGVPTINMIVKNNVEAIKTDMKDFIAKFNSAYAFAKNNSGSTEDGDRGIFVGNASASGLIQAFSKIAYQSVEGIDAGKYSRLDEIGISFDPLKGLTVSDDAKLEEALKNNPKQVENLFNSDNGIATQLYNLTDRYSGETGIITNLTDSYDKSVTYYTDKITNKQTHIDSSATVLRHQYEVMQMQLISLYETQSYYQMAGILA